MPARLHFGGRSRRWVGNRLGGDEELGNRVWRRAFHAFGAVVLLYYLLPDRFFIVLPTETVLLLALVAVLVLEGIRLRTGAELPTIRPWEHHRVASYAFYAVALVLAVLVFPEAVAVAVVLGTALVDPVAGELRGRNVSSSVQWGVPILAYAVIGSVSFREIGGWTLPTTVVTAFAAAAIAVAVERPKILWADDDLVMTLVPGTALTLLLLVVPGWPGLL